MTQEGPTHRIEVIDTPTAAMYRAMTPAQRVQLGLRMHAFAVRTMEAGVRFAHADWSDAEVRREVLARIRRAAS